MKKMLQSTCLICTALMFFFSLPIPVYAQQANITGRVTDNKGQPLSGVTIIVEGEHHGTTTGSNGLYQILVDNPQQAILEFSYLGFGTTHVRVKNRSNINISLKPSSTGLNEVVVVGYGTQKKIDLTGAVEQISGKELQNRPVTNVGDALQGMMANLNVTTNYSGGAPDATKGLCKNNFRFYDG